MKFMHLVYNAIKAKEEQEQREWNVLDVGGGARPFKRANHVVDLWKYENRYLDNTWLTTSKEHYTKESWHNINICDETNSWEMFSDKQFDLVTCSHTLEDLPSPSHSIKQMQRVAKNGYFEIPSRFAEQCYNIGEAHYAGYEHHHWIIHPNPITKTLDIYPKDEAMIKKYHLRAPAPHQMAPMAISTGVFWHDKISYRYINTMREIENFYRETKTLFENSLSIEDHWSKMKPTIVELKKYNIILNKDYDFSVVKDLVFCSSRNVSIEDAISRLDYEMEIIPQVWE